MLKILLVEDSKFLRLATERALTRAGYEVSSAGDGEEALMMAQVKMPDLILLDMLLPKMSGLDVLKALKKDPVTQGIPVVVMTGMTQKNAARLQEDGACGISRKISVGDGQGAGEIIDCGAGLSGKAAGCADAGNVGVGIGIAKSFLGGGFRGQECPRPRAQATQTKKI